MHAADRVRGGLAEVHPRRGCAEALFGNCSANYKQYVTGGAAGSFAGDVLALRLNIDYSAAGITGTGLANRTVEQGPLWGYTVQQVMDLANAVLGGQTWQLPWGMRVSDLDTVVANINSNYENGAIDNDYLQ